MKDRFGRVIRYLRLSVTDACNLRCLYCAPEVVSEADGVFLEAAEIAEIVQAAVKLGIRKVRITGGEPLVRADILDVCRQVAQIDGLEELCMTTNGVLLADYAGRLRDAGVDRVNVSLDSLDAGRFHALTGGDLSAVLRGIDAAMGAGLLVKLNVVLMRGVNDGEIGDFVALTRDRGLHVRFIELMPIGAGLTSLPERFLSADAVLEACPELESVSGYDGVAEVYCLPGVYAKIGLIRPMSRHFCMRCDRVRVTADGRLKPCLHAMEEIRLRGLSGSALETALRDGIWGKPCGHHMDLDTPSESGRGMRQIGG